MLTRSLSIFLLLVVFICCSCARTKLPTPELALRQVSAPALGDDLGLENLALALDKHIAFMQGLPSGYTLRFGTESFTRDRYLAGLRRLREILNQTADAESAFDKIDQEFNFYQVYGDRHWGDVFITGYFEPLILGSRRPTKQFSQPLYLTPPDLLSIELSKFSVRFKDEKPVKARVEGKQVIPYYARQEIDSAKRLSGRGLEICWVDPIDSFFLQIQGSGMVQFEDGKILRLNYSDKNGQPYVAIGAELKKEMGVESVTAQSLERYLRSLSAERLAQALNLNPSYVFFKPSDKNALTSSGIPAIAERSIAVDADYFPKGALALMHFNKPKPETADLEKPEFDDTTRFVFDHDSGGAIKGPGRVDLFFGSGAAAKAQAGVMKGRGELYYLAPKG